MAGQTESEPPHNSLTNLEWLDDRGQRTHDWVLSVVAWFRQLSFPAMGILQDVTAMIADAAGVDASTIGSEIELWYDLRLGGDDMLNLFLHFQKAFGVNLQGLNLSTFSPEEDDVLLAQCTEWVRKRLHMSTKQKYKSLRVSDFVVAAESRSWSRDRSC